MKVSAKTTIWDDFYYLGRRDEDLVHSAYASKEGDVFFITINLKVEAELASTFSSFEKNAFRKGFEFEFEQEGKLVRTTISFEPETEEEQELFDQNMFMQRTGNQWVFAFLPWGVSSKAKLLGSLEK